MDKPTKNELKNKILVAAKNENAFDTAVYYGQLVERDDFDVDEMHFFHGLALAVNKQYNLAIDELSRVSEDSELFEESLVWLAIQQS